MHELPWIMILGSRVRWFANDFHKWRSHELKSLANHIMSDPQIIIHGNECIILFLTRYFMSEHTTSLETNHRSPILQLSLRMVFSYLAWWRHHSWSVTSRKRGILALWRHIRLLFLHVPTGWITTVNIDSSPLLEEWFKLPAVHHLMAVKWLKMQYTFSCFPK